MTTRPPRSVARCRSVRALAILALATTVGCGDTPPEEPEAVQPNAPRPVSADRGATRVIHLLDQAERFHAAKSQFGVLDPRLTITVPVPDPPLGASWATVELPCAAFTSTLRVLRGDEPLTSHADRDALAAAPGFLVVPATQRLSFKELKRKSAVWHRGNRHFPAFLGFPAEATAQCEVVQVAETLRLTVFARAPEGAVNSVLDVRSGSRRLASIDLTTEWTEHVVSFPAPSETFPLVLRGRGQSPGGEDAEFAHVEWIELHWPRYDRVLVHPADTDDTDDALEIHYDATPPRPRQPITLSDGDPAMSTLVRTGGPATLLIEPANIDTVVDIGGVQHTVRGTLDLTHLPNGLHQASMTPRPQQVTWEQSAALFLPLLLDPSLALEAPVGSEALDDATHAAWDVLRKRLECRGDRRPALMLPGTSSAEFSWSVVKGDRLRFAIGAHDRVPSLHPQEGAASALRVDFQPRAGDAWITLHESTWTLGSQGWVDHEVPLPDTLVGPGTLRISAAPIAGSPELWTTAFADPRVVRDAPDSAPRPNVLVYLVDTLRADHLSCYGHHHPTTPSLDRLASEGFLFETCYAVASWTRPSVGSLFSGVYPKFHGALGDLGSSLTTATQTLAETLAQDDYSTWAFISNSQVGAHGLMFEQGFHRFASPSGLLATQGEMTSNNLQKTLTPWLESNGDEPFFLYLHSLDPHGPYHPPQEYFDRYTDGYDGQLRDKFLDPIRTLRAMSDDITDEDVEFVKAVYDGAIRYQDAQFEQLFGLLERVGCLDNTIVLIVSDHGEEFFEHGDWDHSNRLWEELLRVPLLVWLPPSLRERVGPPRRISSPVSHVDVAPSLFELLQIDDLGTRQGHSFVHLMRGEETSPRPIYSDEGRRGMVLDGTHKLIWHYATKKTTELQLFDLATDPHELNDLAESDPATLQRLVALRDRLEEGFDASGRHLLGTNRTVTLDAEAKRQLEALGYMDKQE